MIDTNKMNELFFKSLEDIPYVYRQAHKHSNNNRSELQASEVCGCFYCLKIFDPVIIKEWIDEGNTAICPHCGIDSILASNKNIPITVEVLKKMRNVWFEY